MADLTYSVVAAGVGLWVARIRLRADSLTVPVVVAELVAWSYSPHFFGGGGGGGAGGLG